MAKAKSKSPKAPIQVDIVSDIVCPWCWLGVRYFQKAAKQSKYEVSLNWRPFMLDPNIPEGGVPYHDYMKAKFSGGPSDRFKAMREALEAAGPGLGIDFKFDNIPMRPNTLDAHRLLRWAQGKATGQSLGDAAADALFQAFFTDHKDVGDPAALAQIASGIGMDGDLVATLLSQEDDKDKVLEEVAYFQKLGVSSVPTFIYNGQFALQGAQPAQAHIKALEQAAKFPAEQN